MNENLKEKWITALRSNNYKQGNGFLNYGGCYCALGLLCRVSDIKVTGKQGKAICYDGSYHFPSHKSLKIFDLSEKEAFNIAVLNDEKHKNFNEIANYIERNL